MPLIVNDKPKKETGATVSFGSLAVKRMDVSSGNFDFRVDLKRGSIDFLTLPVGLQREDISEIEHAFRELKPLLREKEDETEDT